jgi:hypothetical protein
MKRFLSFSEPAAACRSSKTPHGRLQPTLLLLLAGLLLALPGRIQAQVPPGMPSGPGEASPTFRLGTQAFRRFFLHDNGFRPLSGWRELTDDPEHTLLVILGGQPDLDDIPGGLENFLNQGGAALIATDQTMVESPSPRVLRPFRELLPVCGHAVSGRSVAAWPAPQPPDLDKIDGSRIQESDVYQGFQGGLRHCVIVRPLEEGGPTLFWNHTSALEKQPLRVATNRPSYLMRTERLPQQVKRLAVFPKGCYYDERFFLPEGLAPYTFAVSAEHGNGRLLLLADHSVFINEMFREGLDNDLLAANAIHWLKGEQRNRALFIEEGSIRTKFDLPLREIPFSLQEIETGFIVKPGNKLLMEMQERERREGRLNKGIIAGLNQGPGRLLSLRNRERNYVLLLVFIATVVLFVYGLSRLRRASHKPEPFVPLVETALARQVPARSPLQQRYWYAVQQDNLAEYARLLAREWLAFAGKPDAGRPRPITRGSWWRRWSLARRVIGVWRLAWTETRGPLSRRRFRGLLANLEGLRAALASGDLRLE